MNDKIVHSPKADEQEKDRSAKEHEDFSDDDSEGSAGDVPGVPVDALTRLRREKRLAMNRESARARRKRKKVLIETLEEHVAELTKRNQRFQAATENLTAKVNKLESDLAIARSTINILSNQSRPDLMGGHGHPQADLGLASAAGKQAELRRLIQAQALSQAQMSSGSGFNASFMDDARRRQALEMQALSQAGREGGMGSAFAARFSQSGIGYGGAPGLLSNASFNTVSFSSSS